MLSGARNACSWFNKRFVILSCNDLNTNFCTILRFLNLILCTNVIWFAFAASEAKTNAIKVNFETAEK